MHDHEFFSVRLPPSILIDLILLPAVLQPQARGDAFLDSPVHCSRMSDGRTRLASADVEGLEDSEYDYGVNASVKNAADAKLAFPALSYAYENGCRMVVATDGAGGVKVTVDNSGGRVYESETEAGAFSTFLQRADLAVGRALCDLGNKHRLAIYACEDNDWLPETPPPYFAFEEKYPAASALLKTSACDLVLAKAGCNLGKQGAKVPIAAATFVAAFEALNKVNQ